MTVNEATDDQTSYRIAFPTSAWCVTVAVPVSLDVVTKGDILEATPTGAVYRFKRAG